jgi:hypothetical protein
LAEQLAEAVEACEVMLAKSGVDGVTREELRKAAMACERELPARTDPRA